MVCPVDAYKGCHADVGVAKYTEMLKGGISLSLLNF